MVVLHEQCAVCNTKHTGIGVFAVQPLAEQNMIPLLVIQPTLEHTFAVLFSVAKVEQERLKRPSSC